MSEENNVLEPMGIFDLFLSDNYFVKVDDWIPNENQKIFKTEPNVITLPVSDFFNIYPTDEKERRKKKQLDSFYLISSKRCYNKLALREHICKYLNYLEAFYDTDHLLLLYYYRIKHMIDYGVYNPKNGTTHPYDKETFLRDIDKYILSEDIYQRVGKMNVDNYSLSLVYKNKTNIGLQYNDEHGLCLYEISVMMNILIPLLMHWMYKNRVTSNIEEFLLSVYSKLFNRYSNINLYNKLYETARTTIEKNVYSNKELWSKCLIRGIDPVTSTIDIVNTIILQMMPKYEYNNNIIMFNFSGIRKSISYSIDVEYEYDFVRLSASKRDGEDNSTQFDKYEAHQVRTDESKFIQNRFNARKTMKHIENKFGPFSDEEIQFYNKELIKNGRLLLNKFQMNLVFNLFYKYFGDTVSINSINYIDYIKLMIAAKRYLKNSGMIILPYIISGRVIRLITRNSINKKETTKLESSEYYEAITQKYYNPKIQKQILSMIAIILSSDFEIVDFNEPDYNGKKVAIISDYLMDEISMYITLI